MHLIHSVAVQNQAPGADAVLTFDLPVNPLSMVLIHVRVLTDTGTPGNYTAWLETIQSAINRVTIRHLGSAIVSMTGGDAAMLAAIRHGCVYWMPNPSFTNNDRIMATLPIFMGRHAYDGKSCFPASRNGELTLELDVDIAATGYDALNFTVETIELLGAKPSEYERKVQISRTFAATGPSDIDLPVGTLNRGLFLFGTTAFTGAAPAPSFGRLTTLVDNVAIGYSTIDFESANGLSALLGRQVPAYDNHIHVETDTGGPTLLPVELGTNFNQFAFLDFDPLGDDSLSIDTAGVSRFILRSEVETANAVRVVPIERIKV